jgi:hypothetical protein
MNMFIYRRTSAKRNATAPFAAAGACRTGMGKNLQEAISTVKVESIYQSKSIIWFALAQTIFKKYQVSNINSSK